MKVKSFIAGLCICSSLLMVFMGCDNNASNDKTAFEKEMAKEISLQNKIKSILTDELCKDIVQNKISEEIKFPIDLSESVVRLSKYPYKSYTSFTGEGAFEGKVNGVKGVYFYEITLKNEGNKSLKDKSSWVLTKLIINECPESGGVKKVFFSGKGVWEVGDFLFIDGKKVTMFSNNGIAQKFQTQSRLNKEQIMMLWDCRERPNANVINLYLPNQKSDYASYIDGVKGLFMYSQNKQYEVRKKSNNNYEFINIPL